MTRFTYLARGGWWALPLCLLLGCSAQREPQIVGVEYETRISGDGVVRSDPHGGPDEDFSAGRPGVSGGSGVPPVFAEEARLRILEVARVGTSSGARVVVQLSRPPRAWEHEELSDPSRCMVDVFGPTADNPGPTEVATGDALAPLLRVGHYPHRIRLVLDESIAVAGACTVFVRDSAVVFVLGGDGALGPVTELWQAYDVPAGAHAQAMAGLHAPSGSVAAQRPPPPAPPPTGELYAAAPPASSRKLMDHPFAQIDSGAAPSRKAYTGQRISLEFKDADILNVLRIIADVAHRNVVATDDVTGRVTIVLHDVPWDQALDILLKSTGLEMVEFDDVITISTSKRLEEERKARLAAQVAGRQLETLQTAYLRVNYVKARDLAGLLRGRSSTSAAAAMVGAELSGDSAGQRRGLLSSRGSAMVNDATNTLIVRDIADGVENAREMVRRLDVQTPQVAIQGLIFEADTEMARDLGVRWGASYVASPETGNPTGRNFPGRIAVGGSGAGSGPDAAPILVDFPAKGIAAGAGSTLGLVLGALDGSMQLDAEITALEKAGKGKVISRPKVITLNNAEAQIQSLEILRVRLPGSGTVINTGPGGTAGGATQATQAIDTGIILRVTPQVSSDGYVLLQMFVKSSVASAVRTDDIPNEISRQATSQVLVRDGETVVIGGVYRQQSGVAESGVPWLRNIPLLGWLFKNNSVLDRRQELLVFITPRVVWRTMPTGDLPSAAHLWRERDKSAYQILSPAEAGRNADPISAIPG